MDFKIISEAASFGGTQGYYSHTSKTTGCSMRFSVFTPAQAAFKNVPVVWYLSGLTCTEDNVTTKAGFQRVASELGLMIVCPDTSPRGDDIPDEDAWDFGKGAGFYVDATEAPWAENYQMYSYITQDLPKVIGEHFAADLSRQGIMGHSMGGHGALTIWRKNPDVYSSVSAFSPIVAPINCPWGQNALSKYLGEDQSTWGDYDACSLLLMNGPVEGTQILVDQGLGDNFMDEQLMPERLEMACGMVGQDLNLRRHMDYDHSYFFIASFIEDHLRHHAANLA